MERGSGANPAAGKAGKVDRPTESEDEEGEAVGAADGDSAGDTKIGGDQICLLNIARSSG